MYTPSLSSEDPQAFKEFIVKKILTLLASIALVVGVVSAASAASSAPSAPSAPASAAGLAPRQAPSAATVAKKIADGKLKRVTAKQMPGLKKLLAMKGDARLATQGTYYIGSYQEQGRLWYDYRYSSFYSSSNYYGYYYYKNWKVCNTASTYCLAAGSYDYYYYYYYYGTWYYGGFYGPYSG
jgi:hypothetical protein